MGKKGHKKIDYTYEDTKEFMRDGLNLMKRDGWTAEQCSEKIMSYDLMGKSDDRFLLFMDFIALGTEEEKLGCLEDRVLDMVEYYVAGFKLGFFDELLDPVDRAQIEKDIEYINGKYPIDYQKYMK